MFFRNKRGSKRNKATMKPHLNSLRNKQFTWKRRKILSRPTSTNMVITALQLRAGAFGAATKSSLRQLWLRHSSACANVENYGSLARLSGAIVAIIALDIVAWMTRAIIANRTRDARCTCSIDNELSATTTAITQFRKWLIPIIIHYYARKFDWKN